MIAIYKNKTFVTEIKHRNYSIDFLKFLCILSVIIVHARTPVGKNPGWNLGRPVWCPLGVPLFFVISGYTWYLSSKRQTQNNISNIYKLYNPLFLIKKFLRFFLPWIFMFAIWQTAEALVTHNFDAGKFFTYFFLCGKPTQWWGSYFVFIMYEMLIFYPLIYLIIDKYDLKGMIYVYAFLILFELFVACIKIPDSIYWYLGPRYAAYIAFGSYLAKNKNKKYSFKNWKVDLILVLSFAIGATSVALLCNKTSPNSRWLFHYSNTCLTANFLGSLYGLPIAYVYFKKVNIKQPWLGFVGSKTYSIMLFQMIYFSLSGYMWASNNFYLQTLIDVLICLPAGIAYYYLIEKMICLSLINRIKINQNKIN